MRCLQLADWKASGRLEALNWAERKAVGHELCTGLAFLHNTASIVHRDLKPENLLFKSETGRGGERVTLKIADFGLSRSINHSRSRRDTSSGGGGTDCWMPPEGLAGKCADTASLTFSYDVHPIGSLLYCAHHPGWLAALAFHIATRLSMAVTYWRCGHLATLLGGFLPGRPAERRHPRLPGRVRPRAERQHFEGPVAVDAGKGVIFLPATLLSHQI